MARNAVPVSFSCFVDRTLEPNSESIRVALAQSRVAWDNLVAHMAETYGLKGALHYMYGKRYGWALRFRRGDRFVLAMYPNQGRLTAQIILNQAQVAVARAMRLPLGVSKVLEAAKDYPEGKWLFIPLQSQKSAEDLRALISLKMSRPKNPRTTG